MNPADLYARIGAHGGAALIERAKFKLTGEDRVRYLNGQVTNDVRKLTPQAAMPACVTTAKGRMCGDIFITASGDHLLVDADPSLRESLAARLERYIISDDVTLEDVTDDLRLIHIIGAAAPSDAPATKSRRYGRDGFDLLLAPAEFDRLWPTLAEGLPVIDGEMLEVLRIEAGIPRWGFELGEETIPAEAGLDRTAIDYHKGCYIGQEVLSRIKSIGHVNKELRGFISTGGTSLSAGMVLYHPADPARETGRLTSAARSFALEKPVALGYLKRGTPQGVLHARHQNDAASPEDCAVEAKELPLIP